MTPPAVGRTVMEEPAALAVPLWTHRQWEDRFPWLVQGTTGRGDADDPWDLGLSGTQAVGTVLDRWRQLRGSLGLTAAVHSRQVHGVEVLTHGAPAAPGLLVTEGVDGHHTRHAGLLLTVSVADCVPVSMVDGMRRAVALVHAGWRGVAGGVAEAALHRLIGEGSDPSDLWLHCGPAICGACYEVGPEVHRAIHPGRVAPGAPTPIDLRAAIAERAAERSVPTDQITVSAHCTRCGSGAFFSHRGGSAGRQMGVLGMKNGE